MKMLYCGWYFQSKEGVTIYRCRVNVPSPHLPLDQAQGLLLESATCRTKVYDGWSHFSSDPGSGTVLPLL